MNRYKQKLKYERQVKRLYAKIEDIRVEAERGQALKLVRYLAKIGATFDVNDANAHSITGSVNLPEQRPADPEAAIARIMGWSGYHESFYATLPSRKPKKPHYFTFRVDDSHYQFSFSFIRPQAGKFEREMTDGERNDTFFARYLRRFCAKHGIEIELTKFERELTQAKETADQKQANIDRLRAVLK